MQKQILITTRVPHRFAPPPPHPHPTGTPPPLLYSLAHFAVSNLCEGTPPGSRIEIIFQNENENTSLWRIIL